MTTIHPGAVETDAESNADDQPLSPEDLQAVAELFEIFFRWDDEVKAQQGRVDPSVEGRRQMPL